MKKHSWRDQHIVRTGKSLLKALYITLGVFLLLFVIFHNGGALYVSYIETKASDAFIAGIATDLAYLKEQGDAVAENELVKKYLISQDSQKLMDILQIERLERNIGLMGVANNQGVILGRTKSSRVVGDNVFLTNPVARIVAQGKSVESVEAPIGFNPDQIFLSTGRPIMNDGLMIGALFSNYLTDDTYATRFRDSYLPHGAEIVFYNKDAGIYGNSFSNTETRKLIRSYFHSSSEWIKEGSSGKTISFNDGSFYLVKNIIFPGLEQSPGGALIFTPRVDLSNVLNLVTAFLTLCIFIFFAFRYHIQSRGEERRWRYYALLTFVSIPVLVLTFLALQINNIGYLKLGRIPYILYNSTMRVQPEFGIYDVDFERHFSIIVDTGDEAINSVQIGLIFDPNLIEVKSLEVSSSTCSYVIENKIDALAGKANFACVILKSDGERGSLKIVDVVLVPRRPGIFTLSFDKEETKVLASDGLGTDVLRAVQSGNYQVDNFDQNLFATSTSTDTSFVIFSTTHPNQSRWYNLPKARFVWRGKPDTVYAYTLDSSPDTIPPKTRTTQSSEVVVPIPGNGTFYFHLQPVSGGPVTHYRLLSDNTPPSIVSINLSSDKIVVGDVVRFSFEAEDTGSGIQKNYYVDLGNHLFLPTGSQLFIPFLKLGDQKVILRVYDDAGNYSEKSQIVHVEAQ